MRSNGKAERLVLRELVHYLGGVDRRESYSRTKGTGQLCETYKKHHEATRAVKSPTEESIKTAVRRALSSLQAKGLVRKVKDAETDSMPWGSLLQYSAKWELTEEGVQEADALHGEYKGERDRLALRYGAKPPNSPF